MKNFKERHILLVEDDEISALVYTTFLEEWGLVVKRAHDGGEALRIMRGAQNFDLILMDINMPVKNGIQTTIELRERGHDVCIILLTGESEDEEIIRSLSAGANDYIFKPVSEMQLLRVVTRWLLV